MPETSLYELLGLTRTATDDEVRTAYRRTARRVHPDAGGSEHAFRRVHAAYRVLGDPGRRQAYDRRLTRSAGASERPAGRGYPASRPGGAVPGPDARARRWYFIAMAACVVLFALAGAVVRDYSVPVAMGMAMVAMVIPPIAAFAVNRPPPNR